MFANRTAFWSCTTSNDNSWLMARTIWLWEALHETFVFIDERENALFRSSVTTSTVFRRNAVGSRRTILRRLRGQPPRAKTGKWEKGSETPHRVFPFDVSHLAPARLLDALSAAYSLLACAAVVYALQSGANVKRCTCLITHHCDTFSFKLSSQESLEAVRRIVPCMLNACC